MNKEIKKQVKTLHGEIIKSEGIRFIRFKELSDSGVNHIMTTRDLDMGISKINDDELIRRNFDLIRKVMNTKTDKIYTQHQVHGTTSLIAGEEGENIERAFGYRNMNADGLITKGGGKLLVTAEADCVPVILFDEKNKVLANIHSGWKGTLEEISGETLRKMANTYGTEASDIKAFILPHIGPLDFEVMEDVASKFRDKFKEIEGFIVKKDEDHFLIDLAMVIINTFIKEGVSLDKIYLSEDSTVELDDLYHSYRRDRENFGIMNVVAEVL